NETQDGNESQAPFEMMVRERLQQAVRTALISVLEEEVDAFIGAVRYEEMCEAIFESHRVPNLAPLAVPLFLN
ncbi:MAG: hypothetical protein ACXVCM_14785, partial [Ktedonobacteraceae bacterium]